MSAGQRAPKRVRELSALLEASVHCTSDGYCYIWREPDYPRSRAYAAWNEGEALRALREIGERR